MWTCKKCKELNGDNRKSCYKCNAPANKINRKVCPKCHSIYSSDAEVCDECGSKLAVYTGLSQKSTSTETWQYIVSIFIPLLGIILGCIYIARNEDDLGKTLIITGVISNLVMIFLFFALRGCSAIFT